MARLDSPLPLRERGRGRGVRNTPRSPHPAKQNSIWLGRFPLSPTPLPQGERGFLRGRVASHVSLSPCGRGPGRGVRNTPRSPHPAKQNSIWLGRFPLSPTPLPQGERGFLRGRVASHVPLSPCGRGPGRGGHTPAGHGATV
ncbi:hypothetical protein VITFI_CDS1198 [Vitreoscilla filiformis]|uniref:Uncharacterized protein n=1 Tax=Vitreoscilla filiformis TaxID=63 RepID=A0A221KD75_VITFI|nr:hypothetical protein VITFI_CDS1198 [Vitreoscilla filiformis]